MQLLKITTVPIKYRVEQETVTVETTPPVSPVKNVSDASIAPAAPSAAQNNTERLIDKNNFRAEALRRARAGNAANKAGQAGSEDQYDVKYCYGKKNVSPDIKATCSYINNTMLPAVSMEAAMDSIDSLYPDSSWEPQQKEQNANRNDNVSTKAVRSVERTKKRMIVEEYAHVDIEYLGGFNYVPESSAPDYVDPEEE